MIASHKLNNLNRSLIPRDYKMPILFIGHGNPMNAIEENNFSATWKILGEELSKPDAILCISAHWETSGTYVTAMERPKTIHDFYGFPKELFEVEYPANGHPGLAEEIKKTIKKTEVGSDNQWGLDHGSWSILKRIYPQADVPVVQLSLDHLKSAGWHYELAKELLPFRRKGVLIIGSGNIVHNLRMVDWENQNGGYDWAIEINENFKSLILNNDHLPMINYEALGTYARLAIPTPEHYLPLLYILALKEENESIDFFNDSTTMGSLSMTSVKISV
jgi:4,5-DOPA dioxygenase extradiol